jgi:hypothetical protein
MEDGSDSVCFRGDNKLFLAAALQNQSAQRTQGMNHGRNGRMDDIPRTDPFLFE